MTTVTAADHAFDPKRFAYRNNKNPALPSGMQCPRCAQRCQVVVDSRPCNDNREIRRRRECLSCGLRWTTIERMLRPPVEEDIREWLVADGGA